MIEIIKDVPLECFNDGKTYLVKAGTQFHLLERKGIFYLRYKHLYFNFVEGTISRNSRFFKSV